jgi:hypothetical protein
VIGERRGVAKANRDGCKISITVKYKERSMKTFQRILVPIDFSQYANKAFEEALMLAKQFKSEVYLLHVVDDIRQCALTIA